MIEPDRQTDTAADDPSDGSSLLEDTVVPRLVVSDHETPASPARMDNPNRHIHETPSAFVSQELDKHWADLPVALCASAFLTFFIPLATAKWVSWVVMFYGMQETAQVASRHFLFSALYTPIMFSFWLAVFKFTQRGGIVWSVIQKLLVLICLGALFSQGHSILILASGLLGSLLAFRLVPIWLNQHAREVSLPVTAIFSGLFILVSVVVAFGENFGIVGPYVNPLPLALASFLVYFLFRRYLISLRRSIVLCLMPIYLSIVVGTFCSQLTGYAGNPWSILASTLVVTLATSLGITVVALLSGQAGWWLSWHRQQLIPDSGNKAQR